MKLEPVDARLLRILAFVALFVGIADAASQRSHWKWLQAQEWPTDLYTLTTTPPPHPVDVGIVGSSRAHFGLPPSAMDLCLSKKLGRPTVTRAANRWRASAYSIDITARDVFSGPGAPPVLIVEAAPESVSTNNFELDYSVASNADFQDIPECLRATWTTGSPRAASCLRPLGRGVENVAFLLHRPATHVEQLQWMASRHGGGQYCYDDADCLTRNATYDAENFGRWDTRVATVLPKVAGERFANYEIGGLPAAHFTALLERAARDGQVVYVINLPVHALYQAEIPAAADAAFRAWTAQTTAAHGAHFLDLNTTAREADRARFLDPDHLNSTGALALTETVCAEVAAALH